MKQFEVFTNPVGRARHAYPYVVVLQADVAQTSRESVVAPVAPRASFPAMPGRVAPAVMIDNSEFVLLVMSLTNIPAASLGRTVASLADRRTDILAAIDYLFFGV